jgi:hypothetical protein
MCAWEWMIGNGWHALSEAKGVGADCADRDWQFDVSPPRPSLRSGCVTLPGLAIEISEIDFGQSARIERAGPLLGGFCSQRVYLLNIDAHRT